MAKKITIFLFFLFSLPSLLTSGENARVTTVLLVRHAEKSASPADNPSLTEQGRVRAEKLIRILGQAGLRTIYTSQYARTHETAEPIAKHLSLPIQQIDANNTQKLVDDILSKHVGEVVLVVGHSNTLPQIIRALGGENIPEIRDNDYDNLFVVTVFQPGKAKVLRLKM